MHKRSKEKFNESQKFKSFSNVLSVTALHYFINVKELENDVEMFLKPQKCDISKYSKLFNQSTK